MKTYTKPSINVIELSIEENIAALVPKTVYKQKNNKLQANSVVEFENDLTYTSLTTTSTEV